MDKMSRFRIKLMRVRSKLSFMAKMRKMTIKELLFTTIKKCFYLFRKIGLYEPLPPEQQKNLDIFESEFLKGHSGMSTFDLLKKITTAFDNIEDNIDIQTMVIE